jgi:predicted O-methyltransferase YrrM
MVGPAVASLKTLASQAASAGQKSTPFDLVVIDADKTEIVEYFKILWETQGMLTDDATVCVDITPFKSQLFVPYVKGKMDDWVVKSGQESINAFLDVVHSLPGIDVEENSGLVVVRKCK